MKKFNKMLSVVLSLVLCLSMVAPALAATFDELQEAINGEAGTYGAAGDIIRDESNTITLLGDVTSEGNENITVSGGKDITLDLNGYNVEGSYGDFWTKGMIEVENGASLTVKDTSEEQTGEIRNTANDGNTVVVMGEMTLEGGTIAADGSTLKSVFVNGGSFTMEDGTLDGGWQGGLGVREGEATVTGGEITSNIGVSVQDHGELTVGGAGDGKGPTITGTTGAGIHVTNGSTVTVNAGNVTGELGGVSATNDGTLTLNGGTIHSVKQPDQEHADIEIINSTKPVNVTIGPDVEFETLGIMGDGQNGSENTMTVEGKYVVSYDKDHNVTITPVEGGHNVDSLYEVFQGETIKNGEQKEWGWIFLGPDALNLRTKVNYEFVTDDGSELPAAIGQIEANGQTPSSTTVPGTDLCKQWVFKGWPSDPFAGFTTDGEGLYDENDTFVPQITIQGMWTLVDNHTPETDPAVAPTCTEEGKTEGSHCSVCKTTFVAQDPIDALGHDMGEWVVTRPAGIGVAGERERVCSRGDYTETEPIPALPYPPVDDEIELEDEEIPLAGLFTRADAIGYLWEQSGSPEWELSDFEDVPEDHYWAVAIGWAQDMGIAVADEDGNFRPDDLVLRYVEDLEVDPEGELQEFLNRYAVYAGIKLDDDELFIKLIGAADDVIMGEEAQVIFDAFFAKLEAALSQAA